MFKKIKEFFIGTPPAEKHPLDAVTTPKVPEPVTETVIVTAPYKVEPPAATIPIPYVPDQTAVVNAAEGSALAEAAPAKKPRKPRAPKAATVVAVKEKAPAKAKAPKAAAIKAPAKAKSKKV